MKRIPFLLLVGVFAGFLLFPAARAGAVSILFEATDLPDGLGPGGDLYEYAYHVSGFTFYQDYGFSTFFDPGSYGDIEPFGQPFGSVTPPNSDWDTVSVDPDPLLPGDGLYDALALTNNASLADPFRVQFIWQGSGTPGSQPFQVYYFDGQQFEMIAEGDTAPVPEPGTMLLLGSGLVGLAGLRRRKQ
jgi:hypothetical protein